MNRLDKRYHIGFWIVKIAIIFVFFHYPNKADIQYFWFVSPFVITLHISYFYAIFNWAFPTFFAQQKYLQFVLVSIGLSVIQSIGLLWVWTGLGNPFTTNLKPHLAGLIGSNFIFFAISFAWRHLNYIIDSSTTKYQIKQELKGSELSFLQSQINPHFLFNVLGCINGLALTKSDKTSFAIHHLNELIQASAKMRGGKKIDLFDELKFLKSYTHLQEMRFSVPVEMQFPILMPKELNIEPMMVIPLLENAFEHGDMSKAGKVNIKFSVKRNKLIVKVQNSISQGSEIDEKTGESLKSLKRKLNLIYPNRFELNFENKDLMYSAHLKLILDVAK